MTTKQAIYAGVCLGSITAVLDYFVFNDILFAYLTGWIAG
jgi:hypothetical protein